MCRANSHKKTYNPCQWGATLYSPQRTLQLVSVSLTKLLLPWPNAAHCQKRAILYKVVHWSGVYSVRKPLAMLSPAGEYLGSDPEEEEGEPVASEGPLSESC